MDNMTITNAQYIADVHDASKNALIKAVINGVTMYVPLDAANTEYDEIMKQVAAGDLTIADAD